MNLLSDYIISKRIRLLKEKAIETYYFANTDKSIIIKRQKKGELKVETRNDEKESTHESTLNEYLHEHRCSNTVEAKSRKRIERSNVFRVPLIPPFRGFWPRSQSRR